MRGENHLPVVVATLAAMVALVGPAASAPKDLPIEYVGGDICVEVAASAEIYSDHFRNWGRSKKVEWIPVDEQARSYHWQVIHKGEGEDLLGPVEPIGCNDNKTDSKRTRDVAEGEQAEWVYKIVVSECDENGEPGAVMCETDPIIVINGGP